MATINSLNEHPWRAIPRNVLGGDAQLQSVRPFKSYRTNLTFDSCDTYTHLRQALKKCNLLQTFTDFL